MAKISDELYCKTCAKIEDEDANRCDGCLPTDSGAPTKYVKKEKKIVITIIGILSDKNAISIAGEYFRELGYEVHTPNDLQDTSLSLLALQNKYIDFIERADFIVVIPKYQVISVNDNVAPSIHKLEIGESTSYEMAIAKYFGKPIVYWQNGGIT